ncbi:MAG: CDP-alcohol phosphatidyltransferase family protein [Lachnospiraceae bacterium]|nr:CDP-alcohol phosphatidyltransferase family protein [Lachnospiraceae bacterium]
MNSKFKPLGYYNYTVILTYIGMLIGFTGIVYALEQNTCAAVICLMAAGFCDMFDGAIASTRERTEQEKNFGIQIDSLSDLICFGILPAVTVYSMNLHNNLVLAVCAFYALCALIRLAYFNVDEQDRQKTSNTCRELYYGMPVTLSALFFPIVNAGARHFGWKSSVAQTVTLFVMAVLFLTPIPLKKPKLIGKICVLICGIVEVGFVILTIDGV